MDAEFFQLAQAAVAALQAANQPNWAEVAALFVSAVVGVGQIGLIAWGLRRMGIASEERNRQLDQQAETLGQIGQALDRQGEALGKIGQALDRQGEALGKIGQALDRQGDVLAELLRRTA